MAIPKYETLMLPLLRLLSDDQPHKISDLASVLENEFDLSESERLEMLPSGRVTTFRSRVHWAATYMSQAGLVQRPKRGWIEITQNGKHVLDENPLSLNTKYLERFPAFIDFRTRSGIKDTSPATQNGVPSAIAAEDPMTPEESLEASYQSITQQLADELLEKLKQGSPRFFERVVVDLLVAMGYGGSKPSVAKAVGKSGDEGIDGVINEDKLGLDVVYIQAKRWTNPVGSPTVHQFTGSLEGKKANKGVLITTSTFTKDAQQFVGLIGKRVVLIDGPMLANFMIEHDVGVTTASTFVVKRIDGDYFEE